MRTKVTKEDVQEQIAGVEYFIMPDGRTTIAHVTLRNGFTVRGESSCVNAANFNKELGEKYAFEKACDKIWELEGYLLTARSLQNVSKHHYDRCLREFEAVGWMHENKFDCEMQELACQQAMDLVALFTSQGHSGSSAPYISDLFAKLASYTPLAPLTGEDHEWHDVGGGVLQNTRKTSVFKEPGRFGGQAYDIEAVMFYEYHDDPETGEKVRVHFTTSDSARPIVFPYTPTTTYEEYKGS